MGLYKLNTIPIGKHVGKLAHLHYESHHSPFRLPLRESPFWDWA